MKFISLFSGVGGFDLGFERAGMECVLQVEQDKFATAILEKHWPAVPRMEDVHDVTKENAPAADLICGGFPCQDLSVAGRRAGLAGEKSGLWREFARIIGQLRPRWVVIENVPGLLSSGKGRDMGILTGKLAELGYWWAYRVLDSQYFGVAQRRRRVFIVGNLADPTAPAKVLFESESSERHTPPSREKGQGNPRIAENGAGGGGAITGWDHETKRIHSADGVAPTIAGSDGKGGQRMPYVVPPLTATGVGQGRTGNERNELDFAIPEVARAITTGEVLRQKVDQDNYLVAFNNRQDPDVSGEITHPLGAKDNGLAVAFQQNTRDEVRAMGGDGQIAGALAAEPGAKQQNYVAWHENQSGDTAKALKANASKSYQGVGVRRLTPLECERLQGFPDGWTDGQSDTQRYKMMGNAVTVNVAEWIGRRIMEAA